MSSRWKVIFPIAAIAAIPLAVSVRAAAESDTYKQLDVLMDVFERVRGDYVDKTEDKKSNKNSTISDYNMNGSKRLRPPDAVVLDAVIRIWEY
jgi:hypothetical protein